ncbi:family 16 glycosyl hydrolase [Coprinopsis sp. MPI-PUGE-AT-0042]|nr:family 16 glycosyl hydrolase [Coprinopsis sp. MPI-PUGE-AT-0042]
MPFTWRCACILAAAWLQLPHLVEGAEYKLLKDYSGATFFDGWEFFDSPDILNHGDVEFIAAADAGNPQTSLAYIDPATNRAIVKVDNTTTVPLNGTRKSVRITTEEAYGFGSVFVADMYHLPYGCSIWSGFWSWNKASGKSWPVGGEIDIFEAINMASRSQMGLHTLPGCSQPDVVEQLSTQVVFTDCAGEYGSGCIVMNTDAASYGPPLNQGGGGVYVTEFVETGINIWFFARDKIPASITPDSKTIDTSTLGLPMGSWPASTCDFERYFKPQNLVIYITLCGDYAGHQFFTQNGCQGRCYEDFVLGEPSHYSEAYFDVASIRVFSVDGAEPSSASSSLPPSSTVPTASAETQTSANTQDPGAAVPMRFEPFLLATAILVVTVALVA